MLHESDLDGSGADAMQLSKPSETLDESLAAVAEGLSINGRPLSGQAWLARRDLRPATPAMSPAQARAGDIETLIQWALEQTGYLPWRNPTDEDLALDHGWNVIPKATRALYQPSGGVALRRVIDDDAALVIELIKALPAATAAQVIACGRGKIRPNALVDVEPRQVTRWIYAKGKKLGKKKHRKSPVLTWEPCDPQTICAARAAYTRWHAALVTIERRTKGELNDWRLTAFCVSAEPWNKP